MVTFYTASAKQFKVSNFKPREGFIYVYMIKTPDNTYKFADITEKVLETFATVKQVKHKFGTYFEIDREEIEGSLGVKIEKNRFTLDIDF